MGLLKNGEDIQKLVLLNNEEQLFKANQLLHDEKMKYRKNGFKIWVWFSVGIFAGIVFSPLVIFATSKLGYSGYVRTGLDNGLEENFNDLKFSDILQDELLVAAYEFNSQSPRFFSNYMDQNNYGEYNVMLREAVGASAAAPTYFDPKTVINHFKIRE